MRYAFTLILALGLAMPAGAQPSAAEAARLEANKQVLMKFFALGGDLEARKKMLTDDYIQHNPRFVELTGAIGSQAWYDAINMARGRIRVTDPDFNLRSTPVILMAEGDLVTAIYKTEGNETWIYGEENNLMSLTFNFTKRKSGFSDNDLVLDRDPMLKGAWYRNVESWRNGRIYQN